MVFSQKNNKKSTVRLRAHQSEWSLPFGLEGITSMSLIVCKDTERGRKYRILTEIESSRLSPNFTKIITFLPYFYITNKMKRTLRFMEENDQADLWNDLLAGQTIPFWPVTESMRMRIKWRNSQLVSQHFSITHQGKTVLRMDNGVSSRVNCTQRDFIVKQFMFVHSPQLAWRSKVASIHRTTSRSKSTRQGIYP